MDIRAMLLLGCAPPPAETHGRHAAGLAGCPGSPGVVPRGGPAVAAGGFPGRGGRGRRREGDSRSTPQRGCRAAMDSYPRTAALARRPTHLFRPGAGGGGTGNRAARGTVRGNRFRTPDPVSSGPPRAGHRAGGWRRRAAGWVRYLRLAAQRCCLSAAPPPAGATFATRYSTK